MLDDVFDENEENKSAYPNNPGKNLKHLHSLSLGRYKVVYLFICEYILLKTIELSHLDVKAEKLASLCKMFSPQLVEKYSLQEGWGNFSSI